MDHKGLCKNRHEHEAEHEQCDVDGVVVRHATDQPTTHSAHELLGDPGRRDCRSGQGRYNADGSAQRG